MPTTTNNGWTIPADTDLVKDGASAIRTLGNAIDSTLGVYTPATSGFVKINTTSFSSVASISVPNNTFSATYTNYKIVVNVSSATGQVELLFRMRASGTDASGANYHSQLITGDSTSVTGERVGSATSGTFAQIINQQCGIEATFYKPFEAVRTTATILNANQVNDVRVRTLAVMHSLATSYDAFTLTCSQNITGTITVYGLAI